MKDVAGVTCTWAVNAHVRIAVVNHVQSMGEATPMVEGLVRKILMPYVLFANLSRQSPPQSL